MRKRSRRLTGDQKTVTFSEIDRQVGYSDDDGDERDKDAKDRAPKTLSEDKDYTQLLAQYKHLGDRIRLHPSRLRKLARVCRRRERIAKEEADALQKEVERRDEEQRKQEEETRNHTKREASLIGDLFATLLERDKTFPWSKPESKLFASEVSVNLSNMRVSIYDESTRTVRQWRYSYTDSIVTERKQRRNSSVSVVASTSGRIWNETSQCGPRELRNCSDDDLRSWATFIHSKHEKWPQPPKPWALCGLLLTNAAPDDLQWFQSHFRKAHLTSFGDYRVLLHPGDVADHAST